MKRPRRNLKPPTLHVFVQVFPDNATKQTVKVILGKTRDARELLQRQILAQIRVDVFNDSIDSYLIL